ncbi:MAG TPA: lamin tail domain-containing protein, partial [Chryseolinea sp.]|nr:lamin tail domain-containing protein [Chryseolinea sp.]
MRHPVLSTKLSHFLVFGLLFGFIACSSPDDSDPEPINEAVFINEIYAAGDDWIELYNASEAEQNIGGYFIYDDATNKYSIPANTVIPAKGFLVLYCDDTGTGLHTNFRLTTDGEKVYLENAAGTLIDMVEFPVLDNGQSYGRYPDGSETLAISGKTSLGSSNDNANAPAIESVS